MMQVRRGGTVGLLILLAATALVAFSYFYSTDSLPAESSFTRMEILVEFEWNGQLGVLDVREARNSSELKNRTLRDPAIDWAKEGVPRFVAESRLRRGQGELVLTIIGYGQPYLAKQWTVKITKPDLHRLIEAARACDAGVVRRELAAGNEPNARYPKDGETALMAAARCPDSHVQVVELLLAGGSDPNDKDLWGRTALMHALWYGRTAIMKALLKAGTDVNAKDNSGTSALIFAAHGDSIEEVKSLLAAGADVSARDEFGETALDVARRRNHTEIVKLLKKVGAAE
jgi:hypothetical protein